jgi:hypothetical protein
LKATALSHKYEARCPLTSWVDLKINGPIAFLRDGEIHHVFHFDIRLSFASHLDHLEANEYAFYLRGDGQSDIYSLTDLANGSSRSLILPGQSTVIHDHLLTE